MFFIFTVRRVTNTCLKSVNIVKHCLVPKSCLTLFDPMDCRLPGSSVRGISQARTLEGIAISFSRGSFWPRDWTHIPCLLLGRQVLYHWAQGSPNSEILRWKTTICLRSSFAHYNNILSFKNLLLMTAYGRCLFLSFPCSSCQGSFESCIYENLFLVTST